MWIFKSPKLLKKIKYIFFDFEKNIYLTGKILEHHAEYDNKPKLQSHLKKAKRYIKKKCKNTHQI